MKSIRLYVDKYLFDQNASFYETVLYLNGNRRIANRREIMGIRYIYWNQSCNAYQWENYEKGFSADCFFFYNSAYHIFDTWFI